MSGKKSEIQPNGLTRRDFLKKTGVAGAALGAATVVPGLARKALAAKRDYILIGHPNPSTGPLAGFGEASPWADNKAIEAINKQGGNIYQGIREKGPHQAEDARHGEQSDKGGGTGCKADREGQDRPDGGDAYA